MRKKNQGKEEKRKKKKEKKEKRKEKKEKKKEKKPNSAAFVDSKERDLFKESP